MRVNVDFDKDELSCPPKGILNDVIYAQFCNLCANQVDQRNIKVAKTCTTEGTTKGTTPTSTAPMMEDMAKRIMAYLEYNTTCNYEYKKVMSHLISQFNIESF